MRGGRRRTIVAAMTETLYEPPPSEAPTDPRRLVRDPDDQVVAGVCAAFGRYTDTDPVLWRVTIAVLTLFGGAGVALYALGWLLLPRVGQSQSVVERLVRRQDVSVAGVVVLVVGAVILLSLLDNGPGVGALLIVAGIAYLVARERREGPLPATTAPAPTASSGTTYGPAAWSTPPPEGPAAPAWGELAPRPPKVRSPLTALTLSAAALLSGVLLAARLAGADGVTPARIVATALLVVGAGLLVGTWWGRGRWLLAAALVLSLALAATAGAQRVRLQDGIGERTWRAAPGAHYSLGAGEATLDLRTLRGAGGADVSAHVGLGHLVVLVPADLTVRVTVDVGAGEAERVDLDGGRTSYGSSDGTDGVEDSFVVGTSGDVTADIDLEVGVGMIEVRRVQG